MLTKIVLILEKLNFLLLINIFRSLLITNIVVFMFLYATCNFSKNVYHFYFSAQDINSTLIVLLWFTYNDIYTHTDIYLYACIGLYNSSLVVLGAVKMKKKNCISKICDYFHIRYDVISKRTLYLFSLNGRVKTVFFSAFLDELNPSVWNGPLRDMFWMLQISKQKFK